jgi:putative lipoic acid-binding regulatory protein
MSLFETDRFVRPPQSAPAEVSYPAEFHFRVIVETQASAEAALSATLAAFQVTVPLTSSQASSGGRYQAYSVSVMMQTRDELHAFDTAIKKVPGVRMLL